MAFAELDVLQPLSLSIKDDQNQWPEFTLKNVRITSQQTGQLSSLLDAHPKFLLRVEGQLGAVDPDYEHLVKIKQNRKRNIVIEDVALYSFSQWDDGSLGFWAGGRAGWYEISSSAPKYKEIYDGIIEAIGMFYYLADKFKKSQSKMTREPVKVRENRVKAVIHEYANSDYCTRRDNEDIREGFFEHHNFLIKSMLEGQEAIEWENAPVLRYLKRKFPADFKRIQSIVLGGTGDAKAKEESEQEEEAEVEQEEEGVEQVAPKPLLPKQPKERNKPGRQTRSQTSTEELAMDVGEEPSDGGVATPPRKGKRKSYLRPRSERSAKRFTRYDIRTTRSKDTSTDDAHMKDGSDDSFESAMEHMPAVSKQARLAEAIAPANDPATMSKGGPTPQYYEARGPGETWVCSYDGCNHKIWDHQSRKGIQLIQSHFADTHANTMEALIKSESRPWADVSHLLERLKGFTSASAGEGDAVMKDRVLPERVLRRY